MPQRSRIDRTDPEVELSLALVGTYPPRRCGIATFTADLSRAVVGAGAGVRSTILAMTDPAVPLEYPECVRLQIRQGTKSDYARAADFVNYSDIRLVSVQHEYGIFGGEDGAHVLDFLARLRKPSVATLHTVLKTPSKSQRMIVRTMADRCERLLVMSHLAADLLEESYGVPRHCVQTIPHGIPVLGEGDQDRYKTRFGVAGRPMILTFGLLSPNKGIETAIRALPKVIEAVPDVVYFVVGATHPDIKRRYGEEYRNALEREAEALGIRENVVFRNQFVELEELCELLQATDIYVTPYLGEAQITSGTLAYAMGAGTAVLSTPYWHAQELLADGRGRLFDFGDDAALGEIIRALLSDPEELARLRRNAYEHTRSMTWPQVGATYVELARQVVDEVRVREPGLRPVLISSLPELRLDHLHRLTDDTGIIQHATYSVPARSTGYCVDDNARALIVALLAHRLCGLTEAEPLIDTYLSYLHHAQSENGDFHNFMEYDRTLDEEIGSEDCNGRALWALGKTIHIAPSAGSRQLAREMFMRAMTLALRYGPRGQAFAILGLADFLEEDPDHDVALSTLEALAASLIDRYESVPIEGWHWFEPDLTYDNAILPLALFKSYEVTGDDANRRVALESLSFLELKCFEAGHLTLIGNDGWHSHDGERPLVDEQPIDATAMVLAFREAYLATGDQRHLERMRASFDWFLGTNRLGLSLYDFATAGCRDGLGAEEVNANEGAESTISFLLALLAMLDVAGNGFEHRRQQVAARAAMEAAV